MENKIDVIVSSIENLKAILDNMRQDQRLSDNKMDDLQLWRERIEGRLTAGAERMNHLEQQATDKISNSSFESVKAEMAKFSAELKDRISYSTLKVFIAGAVLAGGVAGSAGTALFFKFLGAATGIKP